MDLMGFDMRRVDDDIVSMVVVIPDTKNQTHYNDHSSQGIVGVGLTFVVLE
jgi:hypothetical protein